MKLSILIFCLLILGTIASAQSLPRQRVSLKIACNEEGVKDQIASRFKRELRAFSDIDIVDETPDLTIGIIGLVQRSENGTLLGFVISTAVYSNSGKAISQGLERRRACKNDPALDDLPRLVIVRHHYVSTAGADQLDDLCKRVVTKIDTSVFEPDRETFQYINDRLKERQKKP